MFAAAAAAASVASGLMGQQEYLSIEVGACAERARTSDEDCFSCNGRVEEVAGETLAAMQSSPAAAFLGSPPPLRPRSSPPDLSNESIGDESPMEAAVAAAAAAAPFEATAAPSGATTALYPEAAAAPSGAAAAPSGAAAAPSGAAAAPSGAAAVPYPDLDISQLQEILNSPLEERPLKRVTPLGLLAEKLVINREPIVEKKENEQRVLLPPLPLPEIYDVVKHLYTNEDKLKTFTLTYNGKIYLTYQDQDGMLHIKDYKKISEEHQFKVMAYRMTKLKDYSDLQPQFIPTFGLIPPINESTINGKKIEEIFHPIPGNHFLVVVNENGNYFLIYKEKSCHLFSVAFGANEEALRNWVQVHLPDYKEVS